LSSLFQPFLQAIHALLQKGFMLWLSRLHHACKSTYCDGDGSSSNAFRSRSADACSQVNNVPTRSSCIPDYTRVTEADSGPFCKPKHIASTMHSWRSLGMGRRSIQRNTTSDSTAETMPDLNLALLTVHMTAFRWHWNHVTSFTYACLSVRIGAFSPTARS
jgi:hypothetical protein